MNRKYVEGSIRGIMPGTAPTFSLGTEESHDTSQGSRPPDQPGTPEYEAAVLTTSLTFKGP